MLHADSSEVGLPVAVTPSGVGYIDTLEDNARLVSDNEV
jgi:hypothetical protein